MIQLVIRKSSKSYNPKSNWSIFDIEKKLFNEVKEAKEWIKKTYGKSKKRPMYIDDKNGNSKKIGYVIGFRNWDYEQKWIEQHWIGFEKVEELEIK